MTARPPLQQPCSRCPAAVQHDSHMHRQDLDVRRPGVTQPGILHAAELDDFAAAGRGGADRCAVRDPHQRDLFRSRARTTSTSVQAASPTLDGHEPQRRRRPAQPGLHGQCRTGDDHAGQEAGQLRQRHRWRAQRRGCSSSWVGRARSRSPAGRRWSCARRSTPRASGSRSWASTRSTRGSVVVSRDQFGWFLQSHQRRLAPGGPREPAHRALAVRRMWPSLAPPPLFRRASSRLTLRAHRSTVIHCGDAAHYSEPGSTAVAGGPSTVSNPPPIPVGGTGSVLLCGFDWTNTVTVPPGSTITGLSLDISHNELPCPAGNQQDSGGPSGNGTCTATPSFSDGVVGQPGFESQDPQPGFPTATVTIRALTDW